MKDGDATSEVTNEANATQDTTKGAKKRDKGERDPNWGRFYTLLGQFNADIVLKANEDLPYAMDILVEAICLTDEECRRQFGPGYIWDTKAGKCIWVAAEFVSDTRLDTK